jgi:aminopeptidase N
VFSVTVRHFRAAPRVATVENFLTTAFVRTQDGSVTAGQPGNMHQVFPSNDHPRDKAAFSFRFDVPTGTTAVANGVLTGRHRHGARTVWIYDQAQPMATELTQLVVGRFTVVGRKPVGAVRVRDVVPTRLLASYRRRLGVERSHLQWMEQRVGAYPFRTYGTLIAQANLGFALETQTLSLYDSTFFTQLPKGVWSPVMLHELAHQWFGDNVAPRSWSDVWLNEGHASWYEYSFAAQHHYLEQDAGVATNVRLMHELYQAGDNYRQYFGPVARPRSGDGFDLFNPNVYGGGALVLYALREKVGGAAFRRIERTWVHRHAGRSASTHDFVQLASEVSGQDLGSFLHTWLYSGHTPPMPGHPGWSVAPVDSRRAVELRRQLTAPRGSGA